jgi:hypothetical protein
MFQPKLAYMSGTKVQFGGEFMNRRFWFFVVLGAISFGGLAMRANAASAQPVPRSRKFDHAELFAGTSSGQKKAGGSTKGSLVFNSDTKNIEFQREKSGDPIVSIPYAQIRSVLYEQTSKPRYTEAVLISPMFLLAHSKKHYLTIQYTDASGTGQYAIVHLDKKNAQEAVAAVQAETGKEVERAEEK